MPMYHKYPAHKRHPGRDSRRAMNMPRTKVVTMGLPMDAVAYELLKPYMSKNRVVTQRETN